MDSYFQSSHGVAVCWRSFFHRQCGYVLGGDVKDLIKRYLSMCDENFHHLAYVRRDGVMRLFHDGQFVTEARFVEPVCLAPEGKSLFIGSRDNNCAYHPEQVSDIRIAKGVARYWGDFVPQQHLDDIG